MKDKYASRKIHIYFTDLGILHRLKRYTIREFGNHRALSVVCEKAIDLYLKSKNA